MNTTDNRRNSGLYTTSQATSGAAPSSSRVYKRTSQKQSARPSSDSYFPPDSTYAPVEQASQDETASAPVHVSRTRSHRRRQSPLNLPEPGGHTPELMSAPEAPPTPLMNRAAGPPLSYRDPFPTGRPYDPASVPPISPGEGAEDIKRRPSDRRRPSVADRSPLQRLEVKLDDISKEEKRTRMQEAELAAQERAEQRAAIARATSRSVREATSSSRRSRHVSDSDYANAGLGDAETHNRQRVSMPPKVPAPAPPRREPVASEEMYHASSVRQSRPRPPAEGANVEYHRSERKLAPAGVSRGTSFREREASARSHHDGADRSEPLNIDVTGKPVTGLGLSGVDGSVERTHDTRATNGTRHSGRIRDGAASAEDGRPPVEKHASTTLKSSHGEGKGKGTSKREALQPPLPDAVPPEAVMNNKEPGPRYEIPPQAAAAQTARDQVGFSTRNSHDPEEPRQTHRSRLPFGNPFHRHHDTERKYQASMPLDEWKSSTSASLRGADLDLDIPQPSGDKDKAWWDRNGQKGRRSSAGADVKAVNLDGYVEHSHRQTAFNPPLYLKCGPLLRFTGIKSERPAGAARKDIWRGSIMIVTVDNRSSYQAVPTLRVFKQPMDLLPPPPQRIDAESGQKLAPEYVDPLAGQTKTSRSGKTLYVKPVDALEEELDLSRIEDDSGLFEEAKSMPYYSSRQYNSRPEHQETRIHRKDGERVGKYREVKGIKLHADRGVTFWRFNIEIELGTRQARIAYRINRGPAIGFWVPAKGEAMNIMFHSCNGFSVSVDPDEFCGPDPMWRDVLNTHQTRPFHVMIGGGDQIYNDAVVKQTKLFQEWTNMKNPAHKHSAPFTAELQEELENFYLERYSMWFSQGLFGMANSQIPMVNIWDDHDIIDGFGSYPHHFMSTPVFTGLGAVAFKYYMLFQHQSVPEETSKTEPSWLLGAAPGPYINELSRNLFMSIGGKVAFLGIDCRTERMRDSILSETTYKLIFDRIRGEITKGETKHLIVLLGVPIAYPRLNFLENVLTSRIMDPIKALGRTGLLGGFVNKFDGGVEILDDLDDHWTAKHHKQERNWFIKDLQDIAADKSVRITILGGDVHLGAVGQFFSNKKLGIPKDRDHRYIPNVISSAIVNTPPPELMADVLNKRNKIHHLDAHTDEDMIPIFTHDVDGKKRNNTHLLPRRNWCSIREYQPGTTPPSTPSAQSLGQGNEKNTNAMYPPGSLKRTLSDRIPPGISRRLSLRGKHPPTAYETQGHTESGRRGSLSGLFSSRRNSFSSTRSRDQSRETELEKVPTNDSDAPRPNPFHRRPTGLSEKAAMRNDDPDQRQGLIDLKDGLDIVLNFEVNQKDPAGITTPYRLLVPALDYRGPPPVEEDLQSLPQHRDGGFIKRMLSKRRKDNNSMQGASPQYSDEESSREDFHAKHIVSPGNNHHYPNITPPRKPQSQTQPLEYQGADVIQEPQRFVGDGRKEWHDRRPGGAVPSSSTVVSPQRTSLDAPRDIRRSIDAPVGAVDARPTASHRKPIPTTVEKPLSRAAPAVQPQDHMTAPAQPPLSAKAAQKLGLAPSKTAQWTEPTQAPAPVPTSSRKIKQPIIPARQSSERHTEKPSATYIPSGDSQYDRAYAYDGRDEDEVDEELEGTADEDESMLSEELAMRPKRKSWKFWAERSDGRSLWVDGIEKRQRLG